MGIERFFSAIDKNFDVVSIVGPTTIVKTSGFFIDFNSIIHICSSKLVSSLNKKERTLNKDIEDMVIDDVGAYLDDLINKVNCQLIYIALDGVPTFGKILEQKKRRFIGDVIEELVKEFPVEYSFNKSLISPGTNFMKKVNTYLKQHKFPDKTIKTIITDTNEPGEGEFKILDYINKNNITDFIIYSPDADLIILCMILWSPQTKIQIFRYDQNTSVLNIIYINTLVDYFMVYYEERVQNKIDKIRYIKDLCFLMTVFGNDFLPKIEEININMDLYLILDAYIINYVDHSYLLTSDFNITPKSFYNYFTFINKYSFQLLYRNQQQYKYQNFNYATTVNLYIDIKQNKNNQYYKFYLDFIDNFDYNHKYGKLRYYFYNDNEIMKLLKNYQFKNNFNQKYIEKGDTRYQKLIPIEYKSNSKKHLIAMKDLSSRDKELYLINNKLDKYYHLLMPSKIKNKNSDTRIITNNYLKGLSWLVNYYFKSVIDETFSYSQEGIGWTAPLVKDIINYFNPDLLNYKYKNVSLNITPIEQLLYITPIRTATVNKFLDIIDPIYDKNKIRKFIESHRELFYDLDNNKLDGNIMDCTTASFISKCDYYILDNIQPINKFKL